MKRYNLISEMSREHFSQSSIYSLRTPPGSTPGSPARAGSLLSRLPQPTSPLLGNGTEGSPFSSGPCSPVSEEREEAQPEATAASEIAEVEETPAKDGDSPSTTDATAAEAEQAPSPSKEPVSAEKVESSAAESTMPVSMETATVETPSTTSVEEVAATIVVDVIASVSKEIAEAPLSPVTTETAVDQGQAAVEDSGTATTIATQTSFDIPGVPATLSVPKTETPTSETQAPSEPACEFTKEVAVDSEPANQPEVPTGSPATESLTPAEACVDPPAGEESVAEAEAESTVDAEESGQEISQETVAKEMSVDATEEIAVPASELSSTSDHTVEVTSASDAKVELCNAEMTVPCANPMPVDFEVEECIVIECIDDRTPTEVEASVDEAPVEPSKAAPVTEVELGVDDGEAAVDLSDSEEPQSEAVEAHEDLEESVDAEPVVPSVANPESAEVEQCVDPKEGSIEGNKPDQSVDQPTAEEEPATQSDNQEPASPKASEEASSAGESPNESPLDCVKEIRDLIVEVIEVEEPVQHYPQSPKA